MGTRIFTVPWTGTVTNAGGNCDLWEITPGDDQPCRIRGLRLGQTTEVGDTAEECLRVSILRMTATVTSGSGGSAGVPIQVDSSSASATFSAEVNNTTVATTSGSTQVVEELGWNERATPFEVWYPDREYATKAVQGEALVVRLQDTVADDLTFAGTLWIEEG